LSSKAATTEPAQQQQQQQQQQQRDSCPKIPSEMLKSIEELCRAGNPEEAKTIYVEYRKDPQNLPNDNILQLLVVSFANKKQKENALLFFNEMKAWRFLPQVDTYEALVEMFHALGTNSSFLSFTSN
jgi:hypothetical protein